MSGETEGWTVDTLRASFQTQLSDLKDLLNERYATQTRAVDAAFIAQSTAMATALTAAEKAVEAALASAEKAVVKAETAAEKRFESVNEFRAQLTDQAGTFISRVEAGARIEALGEKLQSESKVLTEKLDAATSRQLDVSSTNSQRITSLETRITAHKESKEDFRLTTGLMVAIVGGAVAALALLMTIATFIIVNAG